MDLYAEHILDHYQNPRNFGTIKKPTLSHREANYSCGDDLTIDLTIQNNLIKDYKFRGSGCAISQAAASIMGEEIIGKKVAQVKKIGKKEFLKLLGIKVSERRIKCALLSFFTLKNALQLVSGKKELKWVEILK